MKKLLGMPYGYKPLLVAMITVCSGTRNYGQSTSQRSMNMGVMDYLIGKNVGREESRNNVDNRSRVDAEIARCHAAQSQDAALAIALALKNTREELAVTKKRFFKERQERKNWQKTAEFRKLSLLNHGLTEEQIYAEQNQFFTDKEVNGRTNQKINAESAELDAEFSGETAPSTSNNLSMN
jgi:hypothetical protein